MNVNEMFFFSSSGNVNEMLKQTNRNQNVEKEIKNNEIRVHVVSMA